MRKILSRSLVLLLVILMSQSAQAQVEQGARTGFSTGGVARSITDTITTEQSSTELAVRDVQKSSGGSGAGFYQAIYEDTVKKPHENLKTEVMKRFGIDFDVDLTPGPLSGQFVFTEFFENPFGRHHSSVSPRLKDKLQSDCVRVKAAQAQDVERRRRILTRRLKERKLAFDEGLIKARIPEQSQEEAEKAAKVIVDREIVQRYLEIADKENAKAVQGALRNIPEYGGLNDQQILLRCYEDLSREIDFELSLQQVIQPTRRQLESLQTFVNGKLDDFDRMFPVTDIKTGSTFPRYDLIFDVDVIDMLVFGSPVSTSGGLVAAGAPLGSGDARGGGPRYQDIVSRSAPADQAGGSLGAVGPAGAGGAPVTTATGSTAPGLSEDPDTPGFGTSSDHFLGPLCIDEPKRGIDLDFSPVEEEDGAGAGSVAPAATAVDSLASIDSGSGAGRGTAVGAPATSGTDVPGASQQQGAGGNLNDKAFCDGTFGVDLGNEMLRLIFCVTISFDKVGKTWEMVREDNCIACHLYKINDIFENKVLARSVRPHKNTGTIMESAICEDGYGDDIGFHFFTEWVPVRFYPDICYQSGGVTSEKYAELVGYPEIVARMNKPGFFVNCEADFKNDAQALGRCKSALGGKNEMDYETYSQLYLASLKNKPETFSDVDTSDPWVRLVGHQGVAEREMHRFLYALGQDEPWFGEEDIPLPFEENFAERSKYLQTTKADIRRDPTLKVDAERDMKVEQMLCLQGFFFNQQSQCRDYSDTYRKYEEDLATERQRVMNITQTWNTRSQDFNGENQCPLFQGSGLITEFQEFFSGKFSSDYYLDTNTRRTQTPEQQVTGQVTANMDIEDLGSLFTEISEQVQFFSVQEKDEQLKRAFAADQDRSLLLYGALAKEFINFRTAMKSFTSWWSEMVDKNQFVSKSGEPINVLESFFEKTK